MRSRTRAPLTVTAAVLLGLLAAAPPARARGGGGDLDQGLLVKGHAALQKAEAAWFDADLKRAAYYGKTAERIFRDILTSNPNSLRAALLGGQAATLAGDVPGAIDWVRRYARMTRLGEADPDLHFLQAFVAMIGQKRPDRALRSLQRMYSLNPRVRPLERDNLWYLALSDLGRRYLETDKGVEAARHFATAARIARRLGNAPKERLMLANLGAAYMRTDRLLEAAEVFSGLAKVDPLNALWHYRYGSVLANQSKFVEAVKVYEEVMRLIDKGVPTATHPEVTEVRMRVGNCMRYIAERQRDPEVAARFYKQALEYLLSYVERYPQDARGHKWLGMLYLEHLEKPYKALASFRKAFELDPICDDALRRMVQIHARYAAPPGTDAKVWKAQFDALKKDLDDNREYRKEVQRKREVKTGSRGCL